MDLDKEFEELIVNYGNEQDIRELRDRARALGCNILTPAEQAYMCFLIGLILGIVVAAVR